MVQTHTKIAIAAGILITVLIVLTFCKGDPIVSEIAMENQCLNVMLLNYESPCWMEVAHLPDNRRMVVLHPDIDYLTSRHLFECHQDHTNVFYILKSIMSQFCKQRSSETDAKNVFIDIGARAGYFAFQYVDLGCFTVAYEAHPIAKLLPTINQCLNHSFRNTQLIPAFPIDLQAGKQKGLVAKVDIKPFDSFNDTWLQDINHQRELFADILNDGHVINLNRRSLEVYGKMETEPGKEICNTVAWGDFEDLQDQCKNWNRGTTSLRSFCENVVAMHGDCASAPVVDLKSELERISKMVSNDHVAGIRIDVTMNLPLVWSGLQSHLDEGRIGVMAFVINPVNDGLDWVQSTLKQAISQGYHIYYLPFTSPLQTGRCRFREIKADELDETVNRIFKRKVDISREYVDAMLTKLAPFELAARCDEFLDSLVL
eukprot:TRINITY_DN7158_c0_g3_i1.p1 TRINITY_DN7158_c0_g3~~TRINITY_DN7158_c0_g3_i1.p1  ORF type:complete len:429 (+),score=88.68 TRINITY_DN7158_c0_g3_i1:301-1587(+)